MDIYPEIPKEKGISPWFKAEVKGLYHRGVEVFISTPKYIIFDKEKREWGFAKDNEKNGIIAFPVGKILYDYIVKIDWEGDEFYPFPHIYCNFQNKKEPYEEVIFYKHCGEGEHKYYLQIENFYPYEKGWLGKRFLAKIIRKRKQKNIY